MEKLAVGMQETDSCIMSYLKACSLFIFLFIYLFVDRLWQLMAL
jgi:hypothetical protein